MISGLETASLGILEGATYEEEDAVINPDELTYPQIFISGLQLQISTPTKQV